MLECLRTPHRELVFNLRLEEGDAPSDFKQALLEVIGIFFGSSHGANDRRIFGGNVYRYQIEPRSESVGGGWKLCLFDDGVEVSRNALPKEAYGEA